LAVGIGALILIFSKLVSAGAEVAGRSAARLRRRVGAKRVIGASDGLVAAR
jgi:hypothetical protein